MKLKKLLKAHKKSFSMTDNPDSIYQRSSAKRAGQDSPGKVGKEIMKMLGIEDEPKQNLHDKSPLNMMDIIMNSWGDGDTYEDEDEDE